MAGVSPLAPVASNGVESATPGFAASAAAPSHDDIATQTAAPRPQLVVVNGRLVVAGPEAQGATDALNAQNTTTQATPQVNTPDSAKSLAQAVADENGPTAAPPPPSRAELEAQLAAISAQIAGSSPNAAGTTSLEIRESQIRQALAELTIAPGAYGSARPELRGLATDKVA